MMNGFNVFIHLEISAILGLSGIIDIQYSRDDNWHRSYGGYIYSWTTPIITGMSIATSRAFPARLGFFFFELCRKDPISFDFMVAVLRNCMHFVQQINACEIDSLQRKMYCCKEV